MTANIIPPKSWCESEISFQRYSHDKYFSSAQKDIEPEALPSNKILRAAEINRMKKKLRAILVK